MLATLIKTTRPSFLLLPFSIVALAGALAWNSNADLSYSILSLVLLGALAAHASVNVLNEVHDARTGLDELTQRTPFSGGSGALQENPAALNAADKLGKALVAIVIALGIYFIYLRGWTLLPLGLLGLFVIVAYTPKITHSPWLCLIAPGLGFGPLMLLGSYFVLIGEYSWLAFAVSLIPLLLVSNLLLLNQFPDINADTQVGRRNIIIANNVPKGLAVFRWFLLGSFVLLLALVIFNYLPAKALLGLLSLIFAWPLYWQLLKVNTAEGVSNKLLGLNVMVNLSLPFLIALGLIL